ncbi:serine protease gd-like [Malaya genurostris]|uniref:serine protease gd-like n=1 Tax=Malaya genurostris TaxID=325434 RepID=UPI0026F398C6|nr:serine protease gd-like [Malaya genurostris]
MSRVTYCSSYYLGLPLMLLLWGFTSCVPSNYPAVSPCPALFSYKHDTNRSEYYGFVNLERQPVSNIAEVEISFSIAAQLPSKYIGFIQTIGDNHQLINQISKGYGVSYRVNLPIQDPLPRLTKLTLNGRLLCQGPSEKGNFVTEVNLRHYLRADAHANHHESKNGITRPSQQPTLPPPVPSPVESSDDVKLIDHREQHHTVERTEHEISPMKNTTTYKYVTQVVTYNEYESKPMFQKTTHYSVNTTTREAV